MRRILDDGPVCDECCAAAPYVYAAGDVARNLLAPDARRPFAPVPYFWSDQYVMFLAA